MKTEDSNKPEKAQAGEDSQRLSVVILEWISVRDKLPEDFEQVIALLGLRHIIVISSVQKRNITCADQEIIIIREWSGVANEQVTHWMPMPSLPM